MSDAIIYIIDDEAPVRKSLRVLLESQGLQARDYGSAQEFLTRFDPTRPGCVLADVRMPKMDGLALQQALAERNVLMPVVMMTGHGDINIAVEAMKRGAIDFLEKPFDDGVLIRVIRGAVDKAHERFHMQQDSVDNHRKLSLLTPRERQIMDLLVGGRQNKQIAADLHISCRTVEAHRAKLMKKLRARTLSEVVRVALNAPRTEPRAPMGG